LLKITSECTQARGFFDRASDVNAEAQMQRRVGLDSELVVCQLLD